MISTIQSVAALLVLLFAAALPAEADEIDWDATLPTTLIQQDFTALYRGLKSAHADLFAQRSRDEYDTYYQSMLNQFDKPLSRFDVQLAFQRFAAFGNVAHASIGFPDSAYDAFRERDGRTLPIYLRIVDGVAYVGENYAGNPKVRTGDEILAINGLDMTEWLRRTAELVSADTPYIAHSLLEYWFPRNLWALVGEQPRFELQLRRGDRRFDVTVAASTREEQQAIAAKQPATFELDSNERSFRMLNQHIGYLRPGPFYNAENPAAPWDNAAFIAFIDGAFEHFIDQQAGSLIIDLRQNPGGDNSFSDAMLAWIADEPFRFCSAFLIRSSDEAAAANAQRLERNGGAVEGVSTLFAQQYERVPRGQVFAFDIPYAQPRDGARFKGKVFALINRHSYSNAVNVAAIIQDYKLGVIAGEKTSDMATTYGAMETFALPNTGIDVGFPKAHIIRPSGDRKPDGVTPDWVINSPVVASDTDRVLNVLVERIVAEGGAPEGNPR
ncbi:MAG: S41 family peptidase [Pseudomonadota bacterium]